MNLVDSCGWLEYLADGPNAGFFAGPLENQEKLLVPTICITEVFKRVLQQRGEDSALHVAALMQQGNVVGLDSANDVEAARLGYKHRIPLADGIILATAYMHKAVIWRGMSVTWTLAMMYADIESVASCIDLVHTGRSAYRASRLSDWLDRFIFVLNLSYEFITA